MDFDTRLIVNRPSVISDVQGGEAVIIDLSVGHYYRLDASGSVLWEQFAEGVSIDRLLKSCENDEALRPRVGDIVDNLVSHGLVRPASPGEGEEVDVPPWQFSGFELEQFTDLEDILGLDPIHEVDPSRGWPYSKES
jgi:hypothetical protein